MKIFKYNEFLNESVGLNDYAVGDTVLIRYYLTGDITPVKIISKKTHNYFIVSHRVKGSFIPNAPNHGIRKNEIIGRTQGVGDPVDTTDRFMENPTIQPNISGIIPGWDSWSNDIAF
ncbi:MAG: hypothetical protein ACOC3V_03890 [bacterium]